MAGIGFVLRKLASRDDYLGIVKAYFHSSFAAVGPWIFLICSLGAISFFTQTYSGRVEVNEFFAVMIYNLLFSFLFSSPLYMVSARYVADILFARDATLVPGILIQSLIYLLSVSIPFAIIFYLLFTVMTPFDHILSIVNFSLLCQTWFMMLFLSCIRNFRAITISWIIGLLIASILGVYLGREYGSTGMLFGTNIGLIFILFSILANILAEYPYRFIKPTEFSFYFSHYKGLFWAGLMLFGGMWVDKIVMWFSKESTIHLNHLHTYPIYDGGMFFAYLSIIPVMALFIFSLETNFYETYIKYIRYIETNAPFGHIENQKKEIIKQIKENGRSFLVLQGCLTLVILVSAPTIFNLLRLNYLEYGIFRLGVIGSFFAALNLCMIVFFSYFDSQENLLLITGLMLVSNLTFTLITLWLGFEYYGMGYALSMILTFCVGATLFFRFLGNLTYHIFISNVVKRVKIKHRHDHVVAPVTMSQTPEE